MESSLALPDTEKAGAQRPRRFREGHARPVNEVLSSRCRNGGLDRLESCLRLRAVGPTCLGEVSPAAPAAAAKCLRAGLDEAHGVPAIDEVLRHADGERRLTVRAARHDGGNAGAELALALVDQPFELTRWHTVEHEAEKRNT